MLAFSSLSIAASGLALLSAVSGQGVQGPAGRPNGTLATQLQLQALDANLRQAQIAGQPTYLLPRFSPSGIMNLTYSGQQLSIGQKIPQSEVSSAPSILVAPVGESAITTTSIYTLMMVDADVVGSNSQTTLFTRHWLVNNVRLTSDNGSPYSINLNGSIAVTDYAGPGPAAGSGSHRYVVLLYQEPSSFNPPANLSTAGVGLSTWNLTSYAIDSGLGPLVAANYFQVENGQATATVPLTSAVVTSTLPIQQAISTSLPPRSSSGTASVSGGSAAASASSARSAAGPTADFGMAPIVMAISLVGCIVGAAAIGL